MLRGVSYMRTKIIIFPEGQVNICVLASYKNLFARLVLGVLSFGLFGFVYCMFYSFPPNFL